MSTQDLDGRADASLVAAARRGDRDAFAELIGRHRWTALSVTAELLGSRDLASDAVQEASVVAMTSLDRLRSPESFGAWLCGIALNVARRWLRELRSIAPPLDTPVVDGSPGPAEQVEAAEIAVNVRRAVIRLAEGQRDAVLLFYLQGLTHREVAAELSISVGAVKARLHQARAALAPKLAPLIEIEEMSPMTKPEAPEWVDVTVSEVRRSGGGDAAGARHVVVLKERGGEGELPIWVGPFEATAIALSLEATQTPRPMTYQFAASLMSATGGRVDEVRITGLVEDVFFATVVVHGPAGLGTVDSRPSDALNLALVAGSPVRVDRRVLEDPKARDRTEWRDYAQTTAVIAEEAQREYQEGSRDL
ncbi:MAG: bifunctional nuclease domain-containing protein [Nocardioidaceae bacterium]